MERLEYPALCSLLDDCTGHIGTGNYLAEENLALSESKTCAVAICPSMKLYLTWHNPSRDSGLAEKSRVQSRDGCGRCLY